MKALRCPVVELRQYTLHPGRRDVLVDLFDREFVESQESVGATVLGQFRDLDDPDRFVWLRGFEDMPRRARALESFYGGPVWQAHRDEANATMIDSDDVLLLRPASARGGFPVTDGARPAPGEPAPSPPSLFLATIWYGHRSFDTPFVEFFEQRVRPVLAETGGEPLAYLQSEHSPNTFPALPVRLDEEVFVWFARFTDEAHIDDHLERLRLSGRWREEVLPTLSKRWARLPHRLRLAPTERSALR
ncbi:NIPSNAP family containing protein [Streptomyces lucensis JCM 4490]|uniref:NIPSNAP family containing protein n=1 Tax=Streptomyces lucensis JCM 4490 TaxID=1306176 RepID=A0A918J8Y5_9ACTN|nr:NIPSNAP family protein [Streptomyces lucensis]GGW55611.1 NIPSNAP family containing protein [Streptomyces lucensis JCM 4490]